MRVLKLQQLDQILLLILPFRFFTTWLFIHLYIEHSFDKLLENLKRLQNLSADLSAKYFEYSHVPINSTGILNFFGRYFLLLLDLNYYLLACLMPHQNKH